MIVLPMAGYGRRFHGGGYKTPKYLLPVGSVPVIWRIIRGLGPILNTQQLILVAREDQDVDTVLSECATILPRGVAVARLPGPTEGQAETVFAGLSSLGMEKESDPLFIFNIDTFHERVALPTAFSWRDVDGYLEVFRGDGENWSFVRPDCDPLRPGAVLEVAEKRRISDLCSSGLYHFRDAKTFSSLYRASADRPAALLDGGERYIAPLYMDAIRNGADIRFHVTDKKNLRFAGTPEDYEALIASLEEGRQDLSLHTNDEIDTGGTCTT